MKIRASSADPDDHACPYPNLAESDRNVCAMEKMLFSELVGGRGGADLRVAWMGGVIADFKPMSVAVRYSTGAFPGNRQSSSSGRSVL